MHFRILYNNNIFFVLKKSVRLDLLKFTARLIKTQSKIFKRAQNRSDYENIELSCSSSNRFYLIEISNVSINIVVVIMYTFIK